MRRLRPFGGECPAPIARGPGGSDPRSPVRARVLRHHPRPIVFQHRLLLAIVLALALAAAGAVTAYYGTSSTVTLSVDGKEHQIRTFGSDVGDVLESQGIEPGAHDDVVPSVGTQVDDGTRIAVRLGRPLTLSIDGVTRTMWTTATTVASALSQLGVRASDAALSVSRSATIDRAGMTVSMVTPKLATVKIADGKAEQHNVAA